jgi:hypothetical protein
MYVAEVFPICYEALVLYSFRYVWHSWWFPFNTDMVKHLLTFDFSVDFLSSIFCFPIYSFHIANFMSQDYNSDSDDSYNSDDWDNDGEAESSSAPALRSPDTPGPSTLVPQVIGINLWVSTHVLLRSIIHIIF